MENISHSVLSDYQLAILNEMGISVWQLSNAAQNYPKTESQKDATVDNSPDPVTKIDALEKLKQLKVQTQTKKSTESVLVTCSEIETKLNIFTDILIALGLESKELKLISVEQLGDYIDFPLSWTHGDQVSFQNKQLITPALVELKLADSKKKLWRQLQNAFSVVKE